MLKKSPNKLTRGKRKRNSCPPNTAYLSISVAAQASNLTESMTQYLPLKTKTGCNLNKNIFSFLFCHFSFSNSRVFEYKDYSIIQDFVRTGVALASKERFGPTDCSCGSKRISTEPITSTRERNTAGLLSHRDADFRPTDRVRLY